MMAARCGQEVAWHERMEGLPKEDLVEELLECMTHLCDQVERKPSIRAGTNNSLLMRWKSRRLSGLR